MLMSSVSLVNQKERSTYNGEPVRFNSRAMIYHSVAQIIMYTNYRRSGCDVFGRRPQSRGRVVGR